MKMKAYIGWEGGVSYRRFGFVNPMYKEASEIIMILKSAIEEATGTRVKTVRTCRCSVMEEHLVIQTSITQPALLLEMWPIFFSSDKRVEYKIYAKNHRVSGLIRHYLAIFARTNRADLVLKN